MATSSHTRARVPAGSPEGGEFAAIAGSESGTALQTGQHPAPEFVRLEDRATAIPNWASAGIVDCRVFSVENTDGTDNDDVVHTLTHYAPNRVRAACGAQAPVTDTDDARAYWRDAYANCPGCAEHQSTGHGFDLGGVPLGGGNVHQVLGEFNNEEWDALEAVDEANSGVMNLLTDDAKYAECAEIVADALDNDGWWDPKGEGRCVVDLNPILRAPIGRMRQQITGDIPGEYSTPMKENS